VSLVKQIGEEFSHTSDDDLQIGMPIKDSRR
jgi:hypothetical protein